MPDIISIINSHHIWHHMDTILLCLNTGAVSSQFQHSRLPETQNLPHLLFIPRLGSSNAIVLVIKTL